MKKHKVIAASMIFAATASFADASRYTATLVQPLPAKKEYITEGNIWHCADSSCVLTSEPFSANSVGICRQLRILVGPLAAYGREGKLFDSDKLAKCNS